MSGIISRGMKIGAVSLWLMLLLSERPMYGYEVIRELEKRFSGYWKPKTGTIYPALEKLEQNGLVTSRIEFMEEVPDRRHYALTNNGREELAQSMVHWTKMAEILENYREAHQAIASQKLEIGKEDLSKILVSFGSGFKEGSIDLVKVFPNQGDLVVRPSEPIRFKFLYAKENHNLEIHIEIEWKPGEENVGSARP